MQEKISRLAKQQRALIEKLTPLRTAGNSPTSADQSFSFGLQTLTPKAQEEVSPSRINVRQSYTSHKRAQSNKEVVSPVAKAPLKINADLKIDGIIKGSQVQTPQSGSSQLNRLILSSFDRAKLTPKLSKIRQIRL